MASGGSLSAMSGPRIGGGSDTTAVHVDAAGEIAGVASKATPVGADRLLIEDSAAGDAKKSILLSALPAPTPSIRIATTSPVTVLPGDEFVLVELASPGPVSVVLPAIADHLTGVLRITDRTGDAQSNNITITPDGAETIILDSTAVIGVGFGSITLVGAGTNWSIV